MDRTVLQIRGLLPKFVKDPFFVRIIFTVKDMPAKPPLYCWRNVLNNKVCDNNDL